MPRLLVLDNYDSFTWNLVHYLEELCAFEITVIRNDQITIAEASEYNLIVLSPGPGLPDEAGILIELIKNLQGKIPLLGVCLGHQAMAVANGGTLLQLDEVMHGLQRNCLVSNTDAFLFQGIPENFQAGRYHSWVVDESTLPSGFKVVARDDQGFIMAMVNEDLKLTGVQFHPESIMTPQGKQMMQNWLKENLANSLSL